MFEPIELNHYWTYIHSGVELFWPNVYCAGGVEPNVAAPPKTGAWPKPDLDIS